MQAHRNYGCRWWLMQLKLFWWSAKACFCIINRSTFSQNYWDTIAHLLCCTTTTTTFQFFLNSIVLYIIFIPLGYQCFKNLFFIYTCKFANIFHHFWLNGYITCQKSSQRSCISEIKVNVLQNHITNVSSITGTCHVLGFKQYRHSFTKHRLLVLSSQSPQVNL